MSEKKADAKMPTSFEETYRKLHAAYVDRLKSSVEAIDNVLAQRSLHPLSRDDVVRAQRLAHGLAGSGVAFGFDAVTKAGQVADSFIGKTLKGLAPDKAMEDEAFKDFEQKMLALRDACRQGVDNPNSQPEYVGAPLPPAQKLQSIFEVLVVDDDEHICSFLALNLQQRGMRVTIAKDGAAALHSMAGARPDLIILDITMPGLSGHEVLRRIKQDPEFVGIPVIMVTAEADQQDVIGALHSGAIDYIVKPFNPDKLLARIEKILEASRHIVLIADNDPLILQLLESKFRHAGFKSILVEDGKKAWEQIQKNKPDLVILDMMMPELDGVGVLKKMRGAQATSKTPVIILSGNKDKSDIEEGMKAGAQKYMTKPFISDTLIGEGLALLREKKLCQ